MCHADLALIVLAIVFSVHGMKELLNTLVAYQGISHLWDILLRQDMRGGNDYF